MTKETKLKVVNKNGRPAIYTDKIATEICRRIALGESLKKVTLDPRMPCRRTVTKWLVEDDKQGFMRKYADAINVRTENMFDDLEDMAADDDRDVQRSRLMVDTRKWYLSKVMPKKFGDKLDMTTGGEKMPAPIIPLNVIQTNNSDEQDSSSNEKD